MPFTQLPGMAPVGAAHQSFHSHADSESVCFLPKRRTCVAVLAVCAVSYFYTLNAALSLTRLAASESTAPPPQPPPPANCARVRVFTRYEEETDAIVSRLRGSGVFGDPYKLEGDIAGESQNAPRGVAIVVNTLGRAASRTNLREVVDFYGADVYAYHKYDSEDGLRREAEVVRLYANAWPQLRAVDLDRMLPQRAYLEMVRRYQHSAEALTAVTDKQVLCLHAMEVPKGGNAHTKDLNLARSDFTAPLDSMLFGAVCLPDSNFTTGIYAQHGIWRAWQLLRHGEARRKARYEYVVFARDDMYYFRMPPPLRTLRRTPADMWFQKLGGTGDNGVSDRLNIHRRASAEVSARAFEWLFHARSAQVAAYASRFGNERGMLAHNRLVGAKMCLFQGVAEIGCCGRFNCRWLGTFCSKNLHDVRFDFVAGTPIAPASAAENAYDARFIGARHGKLNILILPLYNYLSHSDNMRQRNCSLGMGDLNACVERDGRSCTLSTTCHVRDFAWPEPLSCLNESIPMDMNTLNGIYVQRGTNITLGTAQFIVNAPQAPESHQWPWIISDFRESARALHLKFIE